MLRLTGLVGGLVVALPDVRGKAGLGGTPGPGAVEQMVAGGAGTAAAIDGVREVVAEQDEFPRGRRHRRTRCTLQLGEDVGEAPACGAGDLAGLALEVVAAGFGHGRLHSGTPRIPAGRRVNEAQPDRRVLRVVLRGTRPRSLPGGAAPVRPGRGGSSGNGGSRHAVYYGIYGSGCH